jgi:hypothetical protein
VKGFVSKGIPLEINLFLSVSAEMPQLETPARFSVSDLIERSRTHNFESLVEFQKVLEAKAQALLVYTNLFPHITVGDGMVFLGLSYLFALRSVGDLAPFLLPSRWYRAAEGRDQLRAEKQAWIIMDLDGMNITESLAHSARRDSEVLKKLAQEKKRSKGFGI